MKLLTTILTGMLLLPAANAYGQVADNGFNFHLRGNSGLRLSTKQYDATLSEKLQATQKSWGLRSSRASVYDSSVIGRSMHNHAISIGEPSTGNLRGYIQDSLNNSNALKARLHQSNAARANALKEKMRLLPKVSLEKKWEKRHLPSAVPLSPLDSNATNLNISANMPLFTSGLNWFAIKSANATASATDYTYLAEERQEVLEAFRLLLRLIATKEVVNSIEATHDRLDKILTATQKRFGAGLVSRTDVEQVRSEVYSVNAQLRQAKAQLQKNKANYEITTGNSVPRNLTIPGIAHLLPATLDAAKDRALNGNYTVAAAQFTSDAAKYQANSVLGSYLPQVSAYATANQLNPGSAFQPSNMDVTVGIKLTMPLFDAQAAPQYRQSKENAYTAYYEAQDVKRLMTLEVETRWAEYKAFKAQTHIFDKKLKSQKKVVYGMNRQVAAGLRPVSDLLRAEIEYASAIIENIQNRINMTASAYAIAIHFPDLTLAELARN